MGNFDSREGKEADFFVGNYIIGLSTWFISFEAGLEGKLSLQSTSGRGGRK
jgi:hypothetical protein